MQLPKELCDFLSRKGQTFGYANSSVEVVSEAVAIHTATAVDNGALEGVVPVMSIPTCNSMPDTAGDSAGTTVADPAVTVTVVEASDLRSSLKRTWTEWEHEQEAKRQALDADKVKSKAAELGPDSGMWIADKVFKMLNYESFSINFLVLLAEYYGRTLVAGRNRKATLQSFIEMFCK
jgi:hypothetical protein